MYWQRKRGRGVYVYKWLNGRQISIPRRETRFLDYLSDEEIDRWVKGLGGEEVSPLPQVWVELVDQFCDYRLSLGRDARSVGDGKRLLMRVILPYFLGRPLEEWPTTSIRLLEYLRERGYQRRRVAHINITLRQFWNYLVEEQIIEERRPLRLRSLISTSPNTTPLTRVIRPLEVLRTLRGGGLSRDWRLIILLAYFFSLRPQELFAVRRRDFLAGSEATRLESSKAMKKIGLFDRLAVRISSQRQLGGTEKVLKTRYSAAWVSCWSRGAARLLIQILNQEEDGDAFLLKRYIPNTYIHKWREDTILPGFTIKDLRRASLYYLGNDVGLPTVALMHHARHSNIQTTMLYCRRPIESVPSNPLLSLDI